MVAALLAFLRRFLPDVRADADESLARGGRIRICIDVEGGKVSRLRVRLLRPDPDDQTNRNLYTWRPPAE